MLTNLDRVPQDSPLAREVIAVPIDAGADEAGTQVSAYAPGYAFQIDSVQHFCGTATGAPTYDVLVDGASALDAAAAPAEGAHGAATLAAGLAARRGDRDAVLTVEVTTGGAEALAGVVYVTIRPVGLRGDA